jgi:16S rRNA (cytosine967-C5)-methyltransferase
LRAGGIRPGGSRACAGTIRQHWQDILAAGNSHPPMCLRANRRKYESIRDASPAQLLLAQLAAAGIAARALDETAVLLEKPLPLDRISGFASGLCSVQDSGAQAAARLLDARDGMRVLDACAAPGGKAAHLLERADIELTALDADVARVARIGENLQRLGLAATVKVADARDPDAWWDGRPFDRILADVPCSASGVVRRHPDAKWLRRESDIAGFVATQNGSSTPVANSGPRWHNAVCNLLGVRGRKRIQVEGFLGRHPDARLAPGGRSSPGDAYQIPDAEHDGFFYALLQKA